MRFLTFREGDGHERAARAEELRDVVTAERVLLETCHRVELISVDTDARRPPAVAGHQAVRRVFEVVAGFDSAVVAEEQLLGQVRLAAETARADGTSGPVLNELMRRALRFGRLVRSYATPGTDRSLADRGVRWLRERMGPEGRVLVVGTGEMGRETATALAAAGHPVTVASRSAQRAHDLTTSLPGSGHEVHLGAAPPAGLHRFEAIVVATRARGATLTEDRLGSARPWVLDLSAPPAVAPAAARLLEDRLLSVDALERVADVVPVLAPRAERRLRRQLEAEVAAFATWLDSRHRTDAVAVLQAEAEDVRRRHVTRLRADVALDARQLAAVEAATAAMLRELLHRPSVELRHGGADAATVRRLFALELRS